MMDRTGQVSSVLFIFFFSFPSSRFLCIRREDGRRRVYHVNVLSRSSTGQRRSSLHTRIESDQSSSFDGGEWSSDRWVTLRRSVAVIQTVREGRCSLRRVNVRIFLFLLTLVPSTHTSKRPVCRPMSIDYVLIARAPSGILFLPLAVDMDMYGGENLSNIDAKHHTGSVTRRSHLRMMIFTWWHPRNSYITSEKFHSFVAIGD